MKTKKNKNLEELSLSASEKDAKTLQEYAFLAQVADMYYNQDMLQSEIAKQLYFSRSKVSRLITQAKESGIVEIKVKKILERVPSLEETLKSTFHLKDAIVISSFSNDEYDQALDMVTDFASIYVSNLLKGNMTVGVSNGNAVNKLTRKIHPMHSCMLEIVQIVGSGSNAHQAVESRDIINRIASVFPGGRSYFLNTPLYMDNAFARSQLLQDPAVNNVFNMMSRCNMILTGLGAFDAQRFLTAEIIREYQTEEHAIELNEKGAVGCIMALYYDINGNYIDCEWNNKCITMPFNEVKNNPFVVAIACGDQKVKPILGALRGGLANVIITNVATATQVLSLHEEA